MPQKFFITHSWKDIEFARKLSKDLRASGLNGFLDAHSVNPGDSIPSRIERGLKECDVYIPIFSPDALKSDWCEWEIDMAIVMNRTRKGRPRIIPVIAKPCDVPDRLMHILNINFVGRYDDALHDLLTKGLGITPRAPAQTELLTPRELPAFHFPWRTALTIAGVVGALVLVVVICFGLFSILSNLVSSIASAPTSTVVPALTRTPTQAIALPPTLLPTATLVPTLSSTLTPTRVPTATPTRTPTPTPTLGIGSIKISSIDGATMVYVPAGEFLMGSSDADKDAYADEKPQHTVYLDAFWIDKYEVTNALYKKCVDAGKCKPPDPTSSNSRISYYGAPRFENYPVLNISWNDAEAFCNWAGKRLPTEAQWEKSARGTDGRIYPWGNNLDGTRLNFCDKNCFFDWKSESVDDGYADTSPVGNYPNGASPYGALDMLGNVWEWVSDWYDQGYYSVFQASNISRNPTGPSAGQFRVVRGGSWNIFPNHARAAVRGSGYKPDYWFDIVGIRCAQ